MNKFLKTFNHKISFIGAFLLLPVTFIFTSCEDEKEIDVVFEGYADMYIQQKMVDNQTLFAPYYLVIANTTINSAMVETPNGETAELEPYEYLTTYIKEPTENEFTTSVMQTGTYRFTGTYGENEPFTITDIFDGRVIGFPQIDSVGYDNTDYSIYVSWELVGGADLYKVKLLSQAGEVVFSGIELTSESNAFKLNMDTEGWVTEPYTGDVLTLQLHAFVFDGDAGDDNWYYNIECDSYSETQVVWGE